MFKGLSNVMAFGELTDVVKSALAEYSNTTPLAEKMSQLYEIGFWGFLQAIDDHKASDLPKTRVTPPMLYNGKRYVFDFHYLN